MKKKIELDKVMMKGKLLSDVTVIDAHVHLGRFAGFYNPADVNITSLVGHMDGLGVDKCFVSGSAALSTDFALGNEEVAQAAKEFPNRIYGLITFNPHYPKEMKQQLKKYSKAGFLGIKIHPDLHNYRADGENYQLAWKFAQDHNLFILAHSWEEPNPFGGIPASPKLFLRFIEDYPIVPVILAHAGGTPAGVIQATQMASHYKNVYLDTCGWKYSFIWISELVNQCGEDKLIYGSDFPFYDFGTCLGRICLADISQSAKEKILSFNIMKILKMQKI
jgi:uncharacterized protein